MVILSFTKKKLFITIYNSVIQTSLRIFHLKVKSSIHNFGIYESLFYKLIKTFPNSPLVFTHFFLRDLLTLKLASSIVINSQLLRICELLRINILILLLSCSFTYKVDLLVDIQSLSITSLIFILNYLTSKTSLIYFKILEVETSKVIVG